MSMTMLEVYLHSFSIIISPNIDNMQYNNNDNKEKIELSDKDDDNIESKHKIRLLFPYQIIYLNYMWLICQG